VELSVVRVAVTMFVCVGSTVIEWTPVKTATSITADTQREAQSLLFCIQNPDISSMMT
jgi:hypothetical protein